MRLPPWHAHPDVWLLIAAVEGGYLWAIRRGGGPVTRRQVSPPLLLPYLFQRTALVLS